jgi:hypothetical protein
VGELFLERSFKTLFQAIYRERTARVIGPQVKVYPAIPDAGDFYHAPMLVKLRSQP